MPEGPEVKLSADLIIPIIQNRGVVGVTIYPTSRYAHQDPAGLKEFQLSILGKGNDVLIKNIQTKGKFMYWTFSNDWYMFSTFGMTGQWSPDKGKHPCFSFDYWENAMSPIKQMYFNDPRHFGTIKFTNNKQDLLDKLEELGWDPLSMPLDKNLPWLNQQLKKTSKMIGEVLMDQTVFSGVGNYIKCESLYKSKISPLRIAKQLSDAEIKFLCESIVDVMSQSYQHQGATIHTYKTAYGEEGKYSTLFKVYGKKIDPLGNKIITETMSDKRTTHWCPSIQK